MHTYIYAKGIIDLFNPACYQTRQYEISKDQQQTKLNFNMFYYFHKRFKPTILVQSDNSYSMSSKSVFYHQHLCASRSDSFENVAKQYLQMYILFRADVCSNRRRLILLMTT